MSNFLDYLDSKLRNSSVNEGIGDAKLVTVFEKGRNSNFKKSVIPHMTEVYDEKEFGRFIFDHMVGNDVQDALDHTFEDLDFELAGISPKIVFIRCKKEDINIIIEY